MYSMPSVLPFRTSVPRLRPLVSAALFSCLLCVELTGCKSSAPPADDNALTSAVNSQLSSDSAITGLPVQASVQGGVVTLSGSVMNDAQRTIAARDAAGVKGIREVVNNLTLGPAGAPPPSASVTAPPPAPVPLHPKPSAALLPRDRSQSTANQVPQPAPIQREPPPTQNASDQPPPPPKPVPPPQPVFRTVTIPSGTTLPVRVTQTLDSATTQTGDSFSGVIASDVVIDGVTALPAGAAVTGNVDAVQEAAHFKGNSLLTVSLTSVKSRGEKLSVVTDPYSVKGKGRGANTAEKTGGGAAVGAILGGIFGGGKGAAIGAAAGGGVGAGTNAVTRGQQVQIPSETVVRFHTSSPLTLKVRTDAHEHDREDSSDPELQRHPG